MYKIIVVLAAVILAGNACMLKDVDQYGDICENNAKVNYVILPGNAGRCNILDIDPKCSEEDISLGMQGKCPKDMHCYKDLEEKPYCMHECSNGKVACDGDCIDPKSSPKYCGADEYCSGYESCKLGCANGQCSKECTGETVNCNGECINPKTNKEYCGANELCEGYESCKRGCDNGKCTDQCLRGEILCDDECIDPMTNKNYCGAKDQCEDYQVCGSKTCIGGTCVLKCPEGQVICDGSCVDPKYDKNYCGADEFCMGYEKCERGCDEGKCSDVCTQGEILCGDGCIDPSTDHDYCGANEQCENYQNCGSKTCIGGKCVLQCPEGQVICDDKCVDPKFDSHYCGANEQCEGYEDCGSKTCINGTCTLKCPGGQVICDGNCINPKNDKDYCGADENCQNYDSDCLFCNDGKCEKKCDGNGSFCQDNQVMKCNGEHLTVVENCGDDKYCSEGTAKVECLNKECMKDGDLSCDEEANQVLKCENYQWTPSTVCNKYQLCSDGVCENKACDTENTIFCENDDAGEGSRWKCQSGHWQLEELCKSGASCGTGNTCGVCHDGNEQCSPSKLLKCIDGNWTNDECGYTCTSDGRCGECKDGEKRCRSIDKVGIMHICKNGVFEKTDKRCNDLCDGKIYHDPLGDCVDSCSSAPVFAGIDDICVDLLTSMEHCSGGVCNTERVPHSLTVTCKSAKCVAESCKTGYKLNTTTQQCDPM